VSDDARDKILARRARFVAAAIAGIGALACTPEPETPPQACLSQPMPQTEADGGEPEPQVCLSVAPDPEPEDQPPPQPCLSPMPPPDGGTS
jgi:hypothetical protein